MTGTRTGEYITQEAVQGKDVYLTIDAKIQEAAEKALANNIEKIRSGGFGTPYEVNTGCAVVLDVKTGNVIALCSYPDFEPQLFVNGISTEKWNEYTEEGKSALINRTIQSAYAPGSTFKMVGAIAALELDKVKPNERVQCTGVFDAGGGYYPQCWYYSDYGIGHGYLTMAEAIKGSCNCFFYEVGTRIGIENLEKYATYFGLGKKTNIELLGELSGTLAGKRLYDSWGETWYYGQTLSAVIGQAENSFTPLQMARYVAMLANGGKAIDVSIIKEIKNSDGTKLNDLNVKSEIDERIGITKANNENLNIKEENVKIILEGMKSVATEEGGTAYSIFKDFPIEIGGKTGSAEAGDSVNAWFVGFAPYENPEIAVVVFAENGHHGYYTAEVVRGIMEAYFGFNEIVPENKEAMPYTGQIN